MNGQVIKPADIAIPYTGVDDYVLINLGEASRLSHQIL